MTKKDPYRYIGCKLKKGIYNYEGNLLLSEGQILTKVIIDKLIMRNIDIEQYQNLIVPVLDEELLDLEKQEMLLQSTVSEIKEIFSKIREGNDAFQEVESNVLPVVEHLTKNYDLSTLMEGLQSKDDYTFRHNIGVSVLASMLAKWMKLSESEIRLVSMGGLLHDIGKLEIPDEILHKRGPLTRSEFEIVKKHPVWGYEILKKSGIYSEEICLMALEHHEREDGRGYPDGKTRDEISFYGKLIAIVDVFHAMTSDRVYRAGQPIHEVLQQLKEDAFGVLEPKMTHVFIQRIMEMSIGCQVVLSNGTIGRIVYINPHDPTSPIVKVDNDLIDLSKSDLSIRTMGNFSISMSS